MTYIMMILILLVIILMSYNLYLGKQVVENQKDLDNLQESIKHSKEDLEKVTKQSKVIYFETQSLQNRKAEILNDIAELNNSASQMRQERTKLQKEFDVMKGAMQDSLDAETAKYKEELKIQQDEYYKDIAKDFVEDFKKLNQNKLLAAQELQEKLTELRSAVDSATQIIKAETEQENYNDFHRIQLTEQEIQDIQQLQSAIVGISPLAELAINKVIWKIYYEKPFSDLIGRVFQNGSSNITGIYKITNIQNKMCYVGQAVNIGERWRQHIKRAIGAEERTNNKLYPAMEHIGPWNFTFDIIEECSREKLNAREDYWQEFYHAKDYGYSIK